MHSAYYLIPPNPHRMIIRIDKTLRFLSDKSGGSNAAQQFRRGLRAVASASSPSVNLRQSAKHIKRLGFPLLTFFHHHVAHVPAKRGIVLEDLRVKP
jgi:hypothetical protein